MSLCKYKNIFGKPFSGSHAVRLGGVAAVDLLATVAASAVIAHWFDVNIAAVLLILLIISAFTHRAFCVETPLTNAILGPHIKKSSRR